MKLKRAVSSILFLVMLLGSLAACSNGTPSDPDNISSGAVSGTDSNTDAEPVLIASGLDPASAEPKRSVKTFQDIASFFGRRINNWQECYRSITLTEDDRTAVLEYIDLLTDEFDYEIVDAYFFDPAADDPFSGYFLSGTWEVCLGLSTVDTGREMTGKTNRVACDIRLYCINGKLAMSFSDLFHTEDYGFRRSGHEGDRFNEVFGQRALDAYYLDNGRYYNGSDGVLSVEAGTHGEAVILLNGDTLLYSTDAGVHMETYADYACDDYEIEIYDFLDGVESEMIEVAIHKSLSGGEVYTLSDALGLRCESYIWLRNARFGNTGGFSSTSEPNGRSALNALTVRVLQWDEVECVVYIAMDVVYELEPMTVEILAAMPAYGSLWGDSFKSSEAITLKVGDSLELKYNGSYVFMPNYETYDWRISSGQGVSISGYGDTCTVTGVSPGEIIIKCVYSYGKDEPDVLTGIPRNENHTKTKLYYIKVVS